MRRSKAARVSRGSGPQYSRVPDKLVRNKPDRRSVVARVLDVEVMPRYFQILLSTSLRSGRRAGGHGEEVSGSLVAGEVDLEAGTLRVERQVDLPESPHLPGRRSVRGIAPFADGVAATNTSQLFLLDRELTRILDCHSERRFGDIHSLAARDGELFVTATAADCIVGFDRGLTRTFEWWAGSEPVLEPYLRDWQRGRIAADHDFRHDANPGSRFHMNHVCFNETGEMLVNLPGMAYREGKSRVFNVTRGEFLFGGRPIPGAIRGRIHDGIALGAGFYLCRTATGDFVKLDQATGEVVAAVDCSVPLPETTGDPLALEHGWLRGAAHLFDEVFLVGQARMNVFAVDMASGTRSGPLRVHGARGDLGDPGLAIYAIHRL